MNHFDQDWRRVQTTKNLNFSQGIPFFKSQKKLNNDNKLATKLEGFKKSYGIGKFAKEAFIKKNGKNKKKLLLKTYLGILHTCFQKKKTYIFNHARMI